MKVINKCLYILLGLLLGPAGCSAPPEYGPPPATDYHLDGEVVSAATAEAIPGIAVDFHGYQVFSATDGTWEIEASFPSEPGATFLEVRDIDGEENGGLFVDKTVPLNPTRSADGTWIQHDITVDLDPAG